MTIPELNSTIDSLEAGHKLTAYEKELLHLAQKMHGILEALEMYYDGDRLIWDRLTDAGKPFYRERTER